VTAVKEKSPGLGTTKKAREVEAGDRRKKGKPGGVIFRSVRKKKTPKKDDIGRKTRKKKRKDGDRECGTAGSRRGTGETKTSSDYEHDLEKSTSEVGQKKRRPRDAGGKKNRRTSSKNRGQKVGGGGSTGPSRGGGEKNKKSELIGNKPTHENQTGKSLDQRNTCRLAIRIIDGVPNRLQPKEKTSLEKKSAKRVREEKGPMKKKKDL